MVIIIFQFLSQSKIAVDVNIAVLCITSHAVWLRLSFVRVFSSARFLFHLVRLFSQFVCCMQRFVCWCICLSYKYLSSPAFTLSVLLFQLNKLLSLSQLLLRSNLFCFWFFFIFCAVRFISKLYLSFTRFCASKWGRTVCQRLIFDNFTHSFMCDMDAIALNGPKHRMPTMEMLVQSYNAQALLEMYFCDEQEQYGIYHILRFDCNETIPSSSWSAKAVDDDAACFWFWWSCVLSAIAMVSCNESFCGNECPSSTLWIISLNCPKCIYISNLF